MQRRKFIASSMTLLQEPEERVAMKLGRKLEWNPEKEKFINDDEANSMLSRPQRVPYGTDKIK